MGALLATIESEGYTGCLPQLGLGIRMDGRSFRFKIGFGLYLNETHFGATVFSNVEQVDIKDLPKQVVRLSIVP